MEKPKPLTNDEGEVRELTEEDLAQFSPFSSLPEELQALLTSARVAVQESPQEPLEAPAA